MPRNLKHFFCLLLVLCLTGALAVSACGQGKKVPKPPKTKVVLPTPGEEPPGFFDESVTSEKAMMVDPGVSLKLCVAEGELRINGWHRNEVRVFVKQGRKFRLKALEKSGDSGKVNWLWIGNVVEGRPGPAAECLAGESIEIDAPMGASLDLSGREVRTVVDSLKKVNASIASGAITLRNITGGITAQTDRGDMIVENSSGGIGLVGYTGNIVISDVKPGQTIGETLKAKTNSGTITMQNVEHRQIYANSISGSLYFDGKFLSGGIYNFRTQIGSIKLLIPAASSCTLTTTYGDGDFTSEIPHKILTENITPRAKIVVSKIGSGDATVTLTTTSGSIGIRKQTPL